MKGKFVTFEGCEGVGKSKQLSMLCKYLDNKKIEYVFTREPGGTAISEKIRELILDGKNSEMTDECEALLYAAARAQHLENVVKPALEKGILVLCDRYIDSSLAYQGYARGLGKEFIENINCFAFKNFMPDLTLFLDLPPEKAFERKGGVDKNDRLELSGMTFHKKVYEGYIKVSEKYKDRFIRIDSSGTKEQTSSKILEALMNKGII